ncbi:hypothetical protein EV356DRAFT_566894 [Viridothelium virens]|uniref:Uncharacterized protein n=1 Tax=Viridothelium virens TaxID=1048519 RepID=A0A6A6HA68_VIRVR|nr:hypothetical protein EV356DRAFT_566894 [Viridothelium virens]
MAGVSHRRDAELKMERTGARGTNETWALSEETRGDGEQADVAFGGRIGVLGMVRTYFGTGTKVVPGKDPQRWRCATTLSGRAGRWGGVHCRGVPIIHRPPSVVVSPQSVKSTLESLQSVLHPAARYSYGLFSETAHQVLPGGSTAQTWGKLDLDYLAPHAGELVDVCKLSALRMLVR